MSLIFVRNFEIFKMFFFLVVKYVKFECFNYIMYFNLCILILIDVIYYF